MGQWLEHRRAESEGLRLDSSWGLRTFSLSHACDKTKKNLSLDAQLKFQALQRVYRRESKSRKIDKGN